MTCEGAHDAVMLYHEKRIKPLKSIALHRHLTKCEDCRTLFIAMDELQNLELTEAPENLTKSIMHRIEGVQGGCVPVAHVQPVSQRTACPLPGERVHRTLSGAEPHGFMAVPLLALAAAASLANIFNAELMAMEIPALDAWGWALGFSHGLVQAGQVIALHTAELVSVNHVFVAAVALAMTAIGIDVGKNTEA